MIRSYVLIVSLFFQLVCISQEILHPHDKHFNFLENKGQWPEAVLFKAPFSGGNLWIQQNKFVFHLQDFSALREIHNDPAATKEVAPILKQTVVHLNFEGSNKVSMFMDIKKQSSANCTMVST